MKFQKKYLTLILAGLLASCSGGGGSKDSGAETSVSSGSFISGVAASGAPLVGKVEFKCRNADDSVYTGETFTDENGRYTFDVTNLKGPFIIKVTSTEDPNIEYTSAATESDIGGTVNVTPLTHLVMANTVGNADPDEIFDNFSMAAIDATIDKSKLDANKELVRKAIKPILKAVMNTESVDIMKQSFSANNSGFDAVLDNLEVTINKVAGTGSKGTITVTPKATAVQAQVQEFKDPNNAAGQSTDLFVMDAGDPNDLENDTQSIPLDTDALDENDPDYDAKVAAAQAADTAADSYVDGIKSKRAEIERTINSLSWTDTPSPQYDLLFDTETSNDAAFKNSGLDLTAFKNKVADATTLASVQVLKYSISGLESGQTPEAFISLNLNKKNGETERFDFWTTFDSSTAVDLDGDAATADVNVCPIKGDRSDVADLSLFVRHREIITKDLKIAGDPTSRKIVQGNVELSVNASADITIKGPGIDPASPLTITSGSKESTKFLLPEDVSVLPDRLIYEVTQSGNTYKVMAPKPTIQSALSYPLFSNTMQDLCAAKGSSTANWVIPNGYKFVDASISFSTDRNSDNGTGGYYEIGSYAGATNLVQDDETSFTDNLSDPLASNHEVLRRTFELNMNSGNGEERSVVVECLGSITPTVAPGSLNHSGNEDSDITGTFSAVDIDTLPANLSYAIVTQASKGNVVLSGTGNRDFTYSPNADSNGTDSFVVSVTDNDGQSSQATISLSVSALNDNPIGNLADQTTDEDNNLSLTLTGTDVDNDPLTFSIQTNPSNGAIACTAAACTYTPNADFNGSDSFGYIANDGTGNSVEKTVNITVNPVNDKPVATYNTVVNTKENTASSTFTLTATDVEGNALTYSAGNGSNGTVSCTAADCTYTPNNAFVGQDSFTYTVSDGSLTSDAKTVNVEVFGTANQIAIPSLPTEISSGDTETISFLVQDVNGSTVTDHNVAVTVTVTEQGGAQSTPTVTYSNGTGSFDVTPQDMGTFSIAFATEKSGSDTTPVNHTETITITSGAIASISSLPNPEFTANANQDITIAVSANDDVAGTGNPTGHNANDVVRFEFTSGGRNEIVSHNLLDATINNNVLKGRFPSSAGGEIVVKTLDAGTLDYALYKGDDVSALDTYSVTINALPTVAHLDVVPTLVNLNADQTFDVVVTRRDEFGNVITTGDTTLTLSEGDSPFVTDLPNPIAIPNDSYSFDMGGAPNPPVADFPIGAIDLSGKESATISNTNSNVTISTVPAARAGTTILTVTDASNPAVKTDVQMVVTPGAASQVLIGASNNPDLGYDNGLSKFTAESGGTYHAIVSVTDNDGNHIVPGGSLTLDLSVGDFVASNLTGANDVTGNNDLQLIGSIDSNQVVGAFSFRVDNIADLVVSAKYTDNSLTAQDLEVVVTAPVRSRLTTVWNTDSSSDDNLHSYIRYDNKGRPIVYIDDISEIKMFEYDNSGRLEKRTEYTRWGGKNEKKFLYNGNTSEVVSIYSKNANSDIVVGTDKVQKEANLLAFLKYVKDNEKTVSEYITYLEDNANGILDMSQIDTTLYTGDIYSSLVYYYWENGPCSKPKFGIPENDNIHLLNKLDFKMVCQGGTRRVAAMEARSFWPDVATPLSPSQGDLDNKTNLHAYVELTYNANGLVTKYARTNSLTSEDNSSTTFGAAYKGTGSDSMKIDISYDAQNRITSIDKGVAAGYVKFMQGTCHPDDTGMNDSFWVYNLDLATQEFTKVIRPFNKTGDILVTASVYASGFIAISHDGTNYVDANTGEIYAQTGIGAGLSETECGGSQFFYNNNSGLCIDAIELNNFGPSYCSGTNGLKAQTDTYEELEVPQYLYFANPDPTTGIYGNYVEPREFRSLTARYNFTNTSNGYTAIGEILTPQAVADYTTNPWTIRAEQMTTFERVEKTFTADDDLSYEKYEYVDIQTANFVLEYTDTYNFTTGILAGMNGQEYDSNGANPTPFSLELARETKPCDLNATFLFYEELENQFCK